MTLRYILKINKKVSVKSNILLFLTLIFYLQIVGLNKLLNIVY